MKSDQFPMSHLLYLFFSLIALLVILPADAQEPVKKFRDVRILFINAPQSAPKIAHLHDGKSSQVVDLPRMNLSTIYKVPSGPLSLRLLDKIIEDPKQIPANAPVALIPETMGDTYLICLSDPENSVIPIRIEVMDAGKEKFEDGMMLWFNLTPHVIGGMLGKQKIQLKPHERLLVNAPVDETDSYPVILLHLIKGQDEVFPICETRWMHDPKTRQLVFVYTETGRRLPRIIGISDFRSPPSADGR
jgi:hypothetical protein